MMLVMVAEQRASKFKISCNNFYASYAGRISDQKKKKEKSLQYVVVQGPA